MIRYVAFLRGINVSGQKLIKMEDLRAYFEKAGFHNVTTYIQSGNVLFESEDTDERKLAAFIESFLEKELGYRVPTIVRMVHELKKVIKNNPFDIIREEEKAKWYVTFLSETPAYEVRASLGVHSNDSEYARLVNKEVYIYCNNYGKTCFSNTFIEKKLGVSATTRNWATLNKIADL